MARTNPYLPTMNIITQTPDTALVLDAEFSTLDTLPIGTSYAGIFAPNATLVVRAGLAYGLYQMTGSTAIPAFTLISTNIFSSLTASLGTVQNSTPTTAQLLGGIVTQTTVTANGTVTLPTGTILSANVPPVGAAVPIGTSFQTVFQNLGGTFSLTVTGATGVTVVGNPIIPTGKSAMFTFVNTGSNTWICYVTVSA